MWGVLTYLFHEPAARTAVTRRSFSSTLCASRALYSGLAAMDPGLANHKSCDRRVASAVFLATPVLT
jgi:hypothetical protein